MFLGARLHWQWGKILVLCRQRCSHMLVYADVFSVSVVIGVFFSISRRKWNHWNKKQQMKDSSLWRLTWREWKPCWMTVDALLWRTTSQPCRLSRPGWVWYHKLCQLCQNHCSCPGGNIDLPRCSPALEPGVCSLCKSCDSSQTVCTTSPCAYLSMDRNIHKDT